MIKFSKCFLGLTNIAGVIILSVVKIRVRGGGPERTMKFLCAVAGGLDQQKSFFLLSSSSFLLMWCGGFTVEFLQASLRGGGPRLDWSGLVVGLWWALVGLWWALVRFGGLR